MKNKIMIHPKVQTLPPSIKPYSVKGLSGKMAALTRLFSLYQATVPLKNSKNTVPDNASTDPNLLKNTQRLQFVSFKFDQRLATTTSFASNFLIAILSVSLLIILILSVSSISEAGTVNSNQAACQKIGNCEHNEGSPQTSISEPLTILLFGTGLIGIGALARRRLHKSI